jgi:hypothetical protein
MLSGILLGITFGLVCGISKERERVKQIAVSVFGAIIVAFLGINLYVYGLLIRCISRVSDLVMYRVHSDIPNWT